MSKQTQKCRDCGIELNDANWYPSFQKNREYICKRCVNIKCKQWRKANPEKAKAQWTRFNRKQGHLPFYENKSCSSFFGVHIAEEVLSQVFKNVRRMPISNPGYDFKCSNGYLIDVKSSCKRKIRERWDFHINHNQIADYFLCLAFDSRKSLNPQHIWLIPGEKVNHLIGLTMSIATIDKWTQYELSGKLNKVITCCNTLKEMNRI